jgi:hypothetical protein
VGAQLNDVMYAERLGIGGKITINDILLLNLSWFDYIVGNTSTNETETTETINVLVGVSTEIIYKGVIYKRFDLANESQSFILTTANEIITKRY